MRRPYFRHSWSMLAFFFLILATSATASFAATETTLYGFSSMPNGAFPVGNLVADSAGNLYGVTSQGGAWGVVFRLTTSKSGGWTETVIHNFTNSPDGAYPSGSLSFDSAGNLYGVTGGGGTDGFGTVFKLTPNGKGWTETILYSFSFVTGSGPNSLIFDNAGHLFGTTNRGGSGGCYDYNGVIDYGCGVVFELSPQSNGSWTEKVLYNFNDSDTNNADPVGTLVLDKAGNLYGATSGWDSQCGNSFDCPYGEIFEVSPAQGGIWTQSVVYSFENTTAIFPGTLVIDSAGNLYGTALAGTSSFGILFELSPPTASGGSWTQTVLYNFLGSNSGDGSYPSSLIRDTAGNFWGTTQWGGITGTTCFGYYAGCGTVFELSPNGSGGWTESVPYKYTDGTDGSEPVGIYRDASGNLYINSDGGTQCVGNQSSSGCGGVLKLSLSSNIWSASVVYDFTSVVDGFQPYAGLEADSAGNFYGTTQYGGAYYQGTVFKLSKNSKGTWQSSILYSFGSTKGDGYLATASVIFDSRGNLYGTTSRGGANGTGTIFELSPGSGGIWNETILHSFISNGTTDGCYPASGLVFDAEGNLYGAAAACGLYNGGTLFKLTPTSGGWKESIVYSFGSTSSGGSSPNGALTWDKQGNLYGTEQYGGSSTGNYYGVVYELSPPVNSGDSWTETVLYAFPGGNSGKTPSGTLAFDNAGNLYGTTEYGGKYDAGIVFRLVPSGSSWTESNLYNFKGANGDGGNPVAGVILDSVGNLYGTTSKGGLFSNQCLFGCGIVFKLAESGGQWRESVLYKFTGAVDGSNPNSALILDSSGNLYGTATQSGSGGAGTVFEIKP